MSDGTPPGMVGIFTDKTGRFVVTVSDFARDTPGGFSLRESQAYRVRLDLAREVIRAYCSPMILEAIQTHDCERIVNRLVKQGAKIMLIPIGHPDE